MALTRYCTRFTDTKASWRDSPMWWLVAKAKERERTDMEDRTTRIIRALRKAAGLAHNAEDAAEFAGLADELDVEAALVWTATQVAEMAPPEPEPAAPTAGEKRRRKETSE